MLLSSLFDTNFFISNFFVRRSIHKVNKTHNWKGFSNSSQQQLELYLLHVRYIELQEYLPSTQLIYSRLDSLPGSKTLFVPFFPKAQRLTHFCCICLRRLLKVRPRVTVTQKKLNHWHCKKNLRVFYGLMS